MKTCFLVSKSDIGGATVYVHNLFNSLNLNKSEIYYLYKGDSSNQIEKFGDVIANFSRINFSNIWQVLFTLRTFLIKNEFEVINVHSTEASILLRIAYLFTRKKIRIIYTVHGWGWRGYGKFKTFILKFIEFVLYKLVKNEYIFLYNNMISEASFLNMDVEKCNVITTGMNQNFLKKNLSKYFTFVFPARLDRSKNHLAAIELLSGIESLKFKLIYVGNGTDNPHFIEQVFKKCDELDFNKKSIEFLGVKKNMQEIYQRSDMVMLISYFEALPLTIIEGLTHGIPCIASNLGGVNDLIIKSFNGLIIDDNFKVKELELFIKKYTENPYEYQKKRVEIYNDSVQRLSKKLMLDKYSLILNNN